MLPNQEQNGHPAVSNGLYPPTNGKLPTVMPEPVESSVDEETIDIREYVDIFFRRRWVLLGTLVLVVVLGMLYTFLQPKIYQSETQILVMTQGQSISSGDSNDVPVLADLAALTQSRSVDTQVAIITSSDLLNEAYEKLDRQTRLDGFRGSLPSWAVTAASLKNTDIITITAQAYTPKAAAAMADSVANTYFKRDLRQNSQATRQARDYVGASLADAQRKLTQANTALSKYKQSSGLIAPDAQITNSAQYLAKLQLDITTANSELDADAQSMDVLRQGMDSEQKTVITSTAIAANPEYVATLARIDDLNAQRVELLQEYTQQAEPVKAIDGQIEAAKAQLQELTKTSIAGQTEARNPIRDKILTEYSQSLSDEAANKARVKALTAEFDRQQNIALTLPEKERQLTELIQQADLLKGTYDLLSKEYYTLSISAQAALPNASFVNHATLSDSPVKPRTATNAALFFLLGCILAVGLSLLIERLDDRVHDQETAEHITGTVTMAGIPKLAADESKMVTDADVHSHFLESFRVLRNNITFAAIDKKIKILTVFSPGPSEGKSTICANLAIAMAMDGKRVLIIDGDLRRPAQHTMFDVSRERGFTSVLTGNITKDEAIVPTKVDGLSLLPSGPLPPNPTEVLNSQQSRQLIRQLADEYDVVIIDSPPCTKLSDVQVISTLADGLLLITALEQTLKTGLRIATRALAQVHAPLIGVVLNQLDLTSRRYGYYSYYYYSYYNYYYYTDETETDGTPRKKRKSHRHSSR